MIRLVKDLPAILVLLAAAPQGTQTQNPLAAPCPYRKCHSDIVETLGICGWIQQLAFTDLANAGETQKGVVKRCPT
jgi:hypothetical protein